MFSLDEIKVKTAFCNKLGNPALNDFLRIMLSPPEAEFNPEKAMNHWYGALERSESCRDHGNLSMTIQLTNQITRTWLNYAIWFEDAAVGDSILTMVK